MSIEYFTFKTLRFITLIGCILVLFLKYYQWPSMVAVFYNSQAQPNGFLPKSQFFYLISALLLAINLLLPALKTLFNKLPDSPIAKINQFFNKEIEKAEQALTFENWINLIIFGLNFLILLALFLISKLNSTEYITNIGDYSWFLPFSFATFMIILVYPFIKIFMSQKLESKHD